MMIKTQPTGNMSYNLNNRISRRVWVDLKSDLFYIFVNNAWYKLYNMVDNILYNNVNC